MCKHAPCNTLTVKEQSWVFRRQGVIYQPTQSSQSLQSFISPLLLILPSEASPSSVLNRTTATVHPPQNFVIRSPICRLRWDGSGPETPSSQNSPAGLVVGVSSMSSVIRARIYSSALSTVPMMKTCATGPAGNIAAVVGEPKTSRLCRVGAEHARAKKSTISERGDIKSLTRAHGVLSGTAIVASLDREGEANGISSHYNTGTKMAIRIHLISIMIFSTALLKIGMNAGDATEPKWLNFRFCRTLKYEACRFLMLTDKRQRVANFRLF